MFRINRRKVLNENVLYVQIWSRHLKVTHRQAGVLFDQAAVLDGGGAHGNGGQNGVASAPIEPFVHPRSLIGDFFAGEALLKQVFSAHHNGKLAPLVVVQPMEKVEGGLTLAEHKALYEMALGAGARQALVYQGETLTPEQLDFEQLKAEEESAVSRTRAASRSLTLIEGGIFLVVVLIMAALITSRL